MLDTVHGLTAPTHDLATRAGGSEAVVPAPVASAFVALHPIVC